jgi:hypothetical protein
MPAAQDGRARSRLTAMATGSSAVSPTLPVMLEGLVGHVMAMATAQNSTGSGSAGQRTAGDAGRSSREMGSGELALRRLRDEGVI